MGNKQIHFKNFTLPDVSLNQANQKSMSIICGSLQKQPNIGPKFMYKTISLKNQKYVQVDKQQVVKDVKSLKILTYNIWFQSHNFQTRLQALFRIIAESNADIICLQEVTQAFTQAFWNNSKILCANGDLFMPVIPMHWYDTLILTKFPIQFYQIPFAKSHMERKLLMGVFQVVNEKNQVTKFSINCVHLQSLNSQELRIQQLKQISQLNKGIDTVCLVGDMNFSDDWPEDKIVQVEYLDLWNEFQPKTATRWTMPKTRDFIQWRPDHIFIKSNRIGNQELRKRVSGKIQRVGTFTIPPFEHEKVQDVAKDQIVRTPSDHMGLIANFTF